MHFLKLTCSIEPFQDTLSIESFPDHAAALPVVTMESVRQANQHENRVSTLSHYYIMLIRPLQALPLARNNRKVLIFNNISKI